MFEWSFQKFLYARKIHDGIQLIFDLRTFHAQNAAIQENILTTTQFGMKARTYFQQIRYPATTNYFTGGRRGDLAENFEKGRFSSAVLADDPDRVSWHHIEANVFERPELFVSGSRFQKRKNTFPQTQI